MILHTQTPVVDETDGLPLPHRIWAVVGISFALCMSVLDINIINVVLPTLSHDFGTSPAVTTWIINGYQLAIVISLLSFSSLGEIYGYRKIFLSGIAMFIVTSLICALSHSFWTLTIARISRDSVLRPLPASTRLSYVRFTPENKSAGEWGSMPW